MSSGLRDITGLDPRGNSLQADRIRSSAISGYGARADDLERILADVSKARTQPLERAWDPEFESLPDRQESLMTYRYCKSNAA